MGKRIAVITGASSGIGRCFALTAEKHGKYDELWAIARREDRLEELKSLVNVPVRPLPMDLTDRENLKKYAQLLETERPEIDLLINCSGFGKFCGTFEVPLEENQNMVDLNCTALMSMCQISEPYMNEGSHIVNLASVAAHQPIPYINVYGATKAFVLSFSRALNRELKSRGISVLAVCPFWTATEFFERAIIPGRKPVVRKYDALYKPEYVVSCAWRDLEKGKDVCKPGLTAKAEMAGAKLLPHRNVMDIWQKEQGLE